MVKIYFLFLLSFSFVPNHFSNFSLDSDDDDRVCSIGVGFEWLPNSSELEKEGYRGRRRIGWERKKNKKEERRKKKKEKRKKKRKSNLSHRFKIKEI